MRWSNVLRTPQAGTQEAQFALCGIGSQSIVGSYVKLAGRRHIKAGTVKGDRSVSAQALQARAADAEDVWETTSEPTWQMANAPA